MRRGDGLEAREVEAAGCVKWENCGAGSVYSPAVRASGGKAHQHASFVLILLSCFPKVSFSYFSPFLLICHEKKFACTIMLLDHESFIMNQNSA